MADAGKYGLSSKRSQDTDSSCTDERDGGRGTTGGGALAGEGDDVGRPRGCFTLHSLHLNRLGNL